MDRWLLVGLIVLGVFAVGTGGAIVLKNTRGFRNNNPGNLIYLKAFDWQGQIGSDPEGFAIFDTMENGVRAMVKDLRTGFGRQTNTVREIVSEYAPPSENPTNAYIAHVSRALNVAPDDLLTEARIRELTHALIRFENGADLPSEILDEGIRRAYI